MFEYPKHVLQHQMESKSLSIFLYHMKEYGIVRDIRQSDYGIDLEYEFTKKHEELNYQSVIGKSIKIQLKARNGVKKGRGGYFVNNIKQSTLIYWAEISYSTNVLVVLVDVITERIYFSWPVFWEATTQITKNVQKGKIQVYCSTLSPESSPAFIDSLTLAPSITNLLDMFKLYLINFEGFYELYYSAKYNDSMGDLFDTDKKIQNFKLLLEIANILLWDNIKMKSEYQFTIDSFINKTPDKRAWNADMIPHINRLLFEINKQIKFIRDSIIKAFPYWVCKNEEILEFAFTHDISLLVNEKESDAFMEFNESNQMIRRDCDKYIKEQVDKIKEQHQ